MAGKFVSAGTLDKPTARDEAWLQAEQELEDRRAERERNKASHDGKTLFEVLQANKAAKEEAFQESIKLKHQFRALNDDEVDFLDSQADAIRAKEEATRQETSTQLKLFREKQEATNKLLNGPTVNDGQTEEPAIEGTDVNWAISKKRKRTKESGKAKGLKAKRTVSDVEVDSDLHSASHNKPVEASPATTKRESQHTPPSKIANTVQPKLGLVGYGSDDDSD